jgi:hypothetical protein
MDPEGSLPLSHGPVNCSHSVPAETSLLHLIQFLFNINYSTALLRIAFFKKNLNNKTKMPPSVSASAVRIIKENELVRAVCSVFRPSNWLVIPVLSPITKQKVTQTIGYVC